MFQFCIENTRGGGSNFGLPHLSDQSCKFWRYLRTYEMYVKSICSFLLLLKHKNQSFAISDLQKKMRRNDFILVLSAATVVKLSGRCCCDALVVPFRSIVVDHRTTSATTTPGRRLLQSSTIRSKRRRIVVVIASSSSNDDVDKEEDAIRTTEENDNVPIIIFNKDVSERSINGDEESSTLLARVTFSIFRLFSYCVQAAGAFFFIGLLLNFAGFGYTIDMEHGLVIDKIQNIRNTVQFEMEIQREEREDVVMMKAGSSSSSSGAVGSTKLLESSFETTPRNDVNNL